MSKEINIDVNTKVRKEVRKEVKEVKKSNKKLSIEIPNHKIPKFNEYYTTCKPRLKHNECIIYY